MSQHISAPKKRGRQRVIEKKASSATHQIIDDKASSSRGRVTSQLPKKPTPRKFKGESRAQDAAMLQKADFAAPETSSLKHRSGRTKSRVTMAKAVDDPVAVEALAQRYASDALRQLAEIARTCDSDATRVSAIREILNRALGRSAPRRSAEKDAPETVPILKIVPYINGTRD